MFGGFVRDCALAVAVVVGGAGIGAGIGLAQQRADAAVVERVVALVEDGRWADDAFRAGFWSDLPEGQRARVASEIEAAGCAVWEDLSIAC